MVKKKQGSDKWFEIYYGMASKISGISKFNLINMEYHLGHVPDEVTLDKLYEKVCEIFNPVIR